MLLFNFIFLFSWIWLMYTLFRLKEGKQLSTVLSHPAFQVDPLAAIHHHLQSTQPVSDEKPKKKSSKTERKKKKKDKLKTSSGPQSMDFWLDARTFILSSFMSQTYSYFGCQKIILIKFCIWLTFYVDLSNMVHYRETFFLLSPLAWNKRWKFSTQKWWDSACCISMKRTWRFYMINSNSTMTNV